MPGKFTYLKFALLLIFLSGCKERFEPNLPSVPQGYLVVEGFINAQGPTQIRLSRSTSVEQKKTFKAELNASIKIEGDDNSSFTLSNLPNGLYTSSTLPINSNRKYRLRIKTKNAKEYLSEFVEVKITPGIDSVSWKEEEERVQIYVSSHDPSNKTIYYRYEYDETWEIRSAFVQHVKLDRIAANGDRIIRPVTSNDPQVFYCWKYDTSKNIILASSAKLRTDIINLFPVRFLQVLDDKLAIRYSIQITQYALDKDGYEFMEQMKKNTENLGTIFDPQPSVLSGNIKSISNHGELVVGYIYATTLQQKRIFISDSQLPGRRFSIYDSCISKGIPNKQDSFKVYIPERLPHGAILLGPDTVGFDISTENCIDCRVRGGKNVRPSFW